MEIINEVDWEKAAHDMFAENMKLKQALEEAYKEADYLEGERDRLRWEKCEVEEKLGKLKKEQSECDSEW